MRQAPMQLVHAVLRLAATAEQNGANKSRSDGGEE